MHIICIIIIIIITITIIVVVAFVCLLFVCCLLLLVVFISFADFVCWCYVILCCVVYARIVPVPSLLLALVIVRYVCAMFAA